MRGSEGASERERYHLWDTSPMWRSKKGSPVRVCAGPPEGRVRTPEGRCGRVRRARRRRCPPRAACPAGAKGFGAKPQGGPPGRPPRRGRGEYKRSDRPNITILTSLPLPEVWSELSQFRNEARGSKGDVPPSNEFTHHPRPRAVDEMSDR